MVPAPLQVAVDALRARFGPPPVAGMVLGSGLGGLVAELQDADGAPYEELGLPATGVAGHAGKLVVGQLGGVRVAMLSGRKHLYEGCSTDEVVRAVRALSLWGVGRVVLTSAVGGIGDGLDPGELLVITDHLNFTGQNPLRGPNLDALGPRFPDLGTAYDPALRAQILAVAAEQGVTLHQGVLAAMPGPSYETPAEIRMLSVLGAAVVGMSAVPEAIALAHMGTPLLALGLVSNRAAGLSDGPLSHEEVTEAAALAGKRLAAVLRGLVARWS